MSPYIISALLAASIWYLAGTSPYWLGSYCYSPVSWYGMVEIIFVDRKDLFLRGMG